jgi:hypothetical protein
MIALICFVLAVLASPFKSNIRLEGENAVLRHRLLAAQAFPHDADLRLGLILLAVGLTDVLDDLLCWRFPGSGFLSHLRSFQRLR